jgi:hypothetical protein
MDSPDIPLLGMKERRKKGERQDGEQTCDGAGSPRRAKISPVFHLFER